MMLASAAGFQTACRPGSPARVVPARWGGVEQRHTGCHVRLQRACARPGMQVRAASTDALSQQRGPANEDVQGSMLEPSLANKNQARPTLHTVSMHTPTQKQSVSVQRSLDVDVALRHVLCSAAYLQA